MCINFFIITGQVIKTKQIKIILIFLKNRKIYLQNITFANKYNSKLILLGQLKKCEIFFYNNSTSIALIKDKKIIVNAKRS